MTDLAQIVAGWPLAASMAAAVAAQLRAGKRRSALNEALHELRRPLQAVALSAGATFAQPPRTEDPMALAAAALERLDREINGGPLTAVWGPVDCRTLVQAAVGRWKARATIAESSLDLRWNADRALVNGDRRALAQALDNLIVNAIEHGGPSIVVAARQRDGRLRIAVTDSGAAWRPSSRRGSPAEVLARLSGRRRHGHGLVVVRRIATAHEGRFSLCHSEHGSRAVLELPLALDRSAQAA
jgi:signal transduction histidine kinase